MGRDVSPPVFPKCGSGVLDGEVPAMSTANNVKVDEAIGHLRSDKFAAEINVASGLGMVKRIIRSHPSVRTLVAGCRDDPRLVSRLLNETRRLAGAMVDPNFESPWDITLAAMLTVIAAVEPVSIEAAATMAQRAPQTWWARRLATDLLAQDATQHGLEP